MSVPVSLLDGLASTRSIRRFTEDPIPDDDLSKILFSATRAPTGSNRQGFRFVVLRNGPVATEAKELLGEAFRQGWGEKRSGDGYDKGSGAEADSPKARTARAMQQFVDNFERIPVVVLPCVELRHNGLQDGASIYPAVQNLLLAARSLGYGGVMTGWHRLVEDELRSLIGVPEDFAIAGVVPLGKPAGNHGPVRRRPVAELVWEDCWEGEAVWATDPPGTRFSKAGPKRIH